MSQMSHVKDLDGIEIVLVEDDADLRVLLRMCLELCGAIVHDAPDAATGVRLVRSRAPHVLVTDISMPGRDGFWLFDEIRGQAEHDTLPIVAVTAVANPARVLAKGFDACLTKPIDPDVLCHCVWLALRDRTSRARRVG